MGQGHQNNVAASFTQHVARQLAGQLQQPELAFSGGVVESCLIDCERDPEDSPIVIGENVKLVDLKDNIDVFSGTRRIGLVAPHHLEMTREKFNLTSRPGRSISGKVHEVSDLTAGFLVVLNNEHL